MVKKHGRITIHTSPRKGNFLGRAALVDLVVQAHGLRARRTRKLRRQQGAILRLAVALEMLRQTWSSTKLKPNGGVSTVSGKQTVPQHRAPLSILLQRRTSLSTDPRLSNLVRTASSKSPGPHSLTRVGRFSSFAGQRRPPLPPQQSLYKESMNPHPREPPPAQLLEKNDTSRRNGHGLDLAGRSRNSEPQPPSGPGGRRSHSRKSQRTEPMEVDQPAPAYPQRMQESRSTSNAVPDRDDTKGDLPRGPKAMTSKLPPVPPTVLPPKPIALSERYSGRSPPPHLITRDERPAQRTGDRSIVDSRTDHLDMLREHRNPEIAPPRRRSPDSVKIS